MAAKDIEFSIAVFPFLKTSGPVSIAGLEFRATDDTAGMPDAQASAVQDIARMLFFRDDLRLRSGSYAIIPYVDCNRYDADVSDLANIQAVVAYLYASPDEISGDPFLPWEVASLAIFSPAPVSIHLIEPRDLHVIIEHPRDLKPDSRGEVLGYAGLYNLRHHFWVISGSRLYGPIPSMPLNISQDLSRDVGEAATHLPYRLLLDLLGKPITQVSSRILRSIHWFNMANAEGSAHAPSLVCLAIAFESLLGLPPDAKTSRFVDTVSLLLGRIARLDVWAEQFYGARSAIVHGRETPQLRFVAADFPSDDRGPYYRSLLSYGMEIFSLCLSTLVVGADLAQESGLPEKLVTNHQRFIQVCKVLNDQSLTSIERLTKMSPTVAALDRYRFVHETGIELKTLIGAVRLSAKALVESGEPLPDELRQSLDRFLASKRTDDHINELAAIEELEALLRDQPEAQRSVHIRPVADLVHVVWGYVFLHYYWLKRRD